VQPGSPASPPVRDKAPAVLLRSRPTQPQRSPRRVARAALRSSRHVRPPADSSRGGPVAVASGPRSYRGRRWSGVGASGQASVGSDLSSRFLNTRAETAPLRGKPVRYPQKIHRGRCVSFRGIELEIHATEPCPRGRRARAWASWHLDLRRVSRQICAARSLRGSCFAMGRVLAWRWALMLLLTLAESPKCGWASAVSSQRLRATPGISAGKLRPWPSTC
jgi:hypothetical protein